MKIYRELLQGSPEWLQARIGKPSASQWKNVMNSYSEAQYYADNKANQTKGIAGKLKNTPGFQDGAKSYALELCAEILTQEPTHTHVTYDMEVGTMREPDARMIYEDSRDVVVDEVGGIEPDNGNLWYSPDGMVGTDGLLEIKCPAKKRHLLTLITKRVPTDNMDQLQFGLMVSGRKWIDFMSFNPDFVDPKHQAVVIRVERDEEYIALAQQRAEEFTGLIGKMIDKLS